MPSLPLILLVENDASLRASLSFSLELEGFAVAAHPGSAALAADGAAPRADCLVIGQQLADGDGLGLLGALRSRGVAAPAILLVSNPPRASRLAIAAAGAMLIEMPLLCDALPAAIRAAIGPTAAAA